MEVAALIDNYNHNQRLTDDDILQIRTNRGFRLDLCSYFRQNKNRSFAIELMNTFIRLRKDLLNKILIDDLMLAAYILGLHQQVEDCLLVWEAKQVDFDTYCALDIQLGPFAGVPETIRYLQTQNSEEAKAALKHVTACIKGGDFDELTAYYSEENLPWWI